MLRPLAMLRSLSIVLLPIILSLLVSVKAQRPNNSWPHVYPGMPTGDYSPKWQEYFQVTEKLPNVTWTLPRHWAGNIPVQRPGHPNCTLFYWAFEASKGSFTANNTEPWVIWLNGGPGASSLLGLLFEHGPIRILSDYSAAENTYAWTKFADMVYLDQPVGTGFSTVDTDGLVTDEDEVGRDFLGFLGNLVKVFPNLAKRPLFITGESYAGVYIPYITKAYFETENPPVNLARIAIGNGMLTSPETSFELSVVSILETYPQIIGDDPTVFEYFEEQSQLCGYNLTLQYPQPENFPTLNAPMSGSSSTLFRKYRSKLTMQGLLADILPRMKNARRSKNSDGSPPLKRDNRVRALDTWKRDLSGRANGSIDTWYYCDIWTEMIDYALNFSRPWSSSGGFDFYNIPDALNPEMTMDASVFLNDPSTVAALHAPTSNSWQPFTSPFANADLSVGDVGDPSVEPMVFLTELATNATKHNMTIVIYSGNDDSLVAHLGSQVAIQNTTFGGQRGFTRKPSTSWYNHHGEFGGIVHQERGWRYILVDRAGHVLAYTNPVSALTLFREFILGDNETGTVVTSSSGVVSVIGGEDSPLKGEILPGEQGIHVGSGKTEGTYFVPSATVQAWSSFIATAAPTLK